MKTENSITDREFGALEQELKELRHDFRNMRTIIENSGACYITIEEAKEVRERLNNLHNLKARQSSIEDLRKEMAQFKTRIYTAFSVLVFLGSILAWFIEILLEG